MSRAEAVQLVAVAILAAQGGAAFAQALPFETTMIAEGVYQFRW